MKAADGHSPQEKALSNLQVPLSARSGIDWPALPQPGNALLLSLLYQFEHSQWWPAGRLLAHQLRQIMLLASHAAKTVPFYLQRLDCLAGLSELSIDAFRRVPVLRRTDVQEAGDALNSRNVPHDHGNSFEIRTSGSTGRPIVVRTTEVAQLFYWALNLRYHLWHQRDLSAKCALIALVPGGSVGADQTGAPSNWAPGYTSGPLVKLDIFRPIAEQSDWLVREDPGYLLTYPSNLRALLQYTEATGTRIKGLRQVSCMTEVLEPELRDKCQDVWGVPLVDAYSAQEVGYIAVECPDHGGYHVQSENVMVEILNDKDEPCGVGERGRVVVTALHNFATPLIRYEIGDYAEVGPPCPCGRGLTMLTRILGRTRNMLTLPSGDRIWPRFGTRSFAKIAPIVQHQFVQKDVTHLEARLVSKRQLTPDDEEKLRNLILSRLGHPIEIEFSYHDEIPRSPSGKFEDFKSEVE